MTSGGSQPGDTATASLRADHRSYKPSRHAQADRDSRGLLGQSCLGPADQPKKLWPKGWVFPPETSVAELLPEVTSELRPLGWDDITHSFLREGPDFVARPQHCVCLRLFGAKALRGA